MVRENKSFRLLRLLLFLLGSYPKTKKECMNFLKIQSSAFHNYLIELRSIGFNLLQKDGKYWVEPENKAGQLLSNLLHFTEEEAYVLAKSIDSVEGHSLSAQKLKQKLVAFLNLELAVEAYLKEEKSIVVSAINSAVKNKKQIVFMNYASGNSQTVRNRRVEPFEFKDDFNLVWAFDTELQLNRQFKICRMEDVVETPFSWKHERLHHSQPVDVFRNTGKLNKQVEFNLNLRACNLLIEEYPLAEKHIIESSENQFHFKVPVAKYEGPARFVLGIADDVTLTGDDGFLGFVKEKIKKSKILFEIPQNMES